MDIEGIQNYIQSHQSVQQNVEEVELHFDNLAGEQGTHSQMA